MSKEKKKCGFACMTTEQKEEISRKGGRAAHAKGKAHRWTREEARAAAKLGGRAVHESRGPQWMSQIAKGNKGNRKTPEISHIDRQDFNAPSERVRE